MYQVHGRRENAHLKSKLKNRERDFTMNKSQLTWMLALTCALLAGSTIAQTQSPTENTDIADEAKITVPDMDVVGESTAGDTTTRGPKTGDYEIKTLDGTARKVVGFSFVNHGPNRVMPVAEREIGAGPDRDFEMEFRNRARQDIQFHVTDIPTEYLSERMESYFYFFPRLNLPAIQWTAADAKTFTVVLPTGEPVVFDAASKEIVGGVLSETSPIDLGPDRFKRKFAGISYSGTGLYFRVDRRGNDPRLGTVATVYQGQKTCKIPSSLLFNQGEHSHVEFLFATDAEFNALLKKKCQMSF